MRTTVLDTGALIALEHRDGRMLALAADLVGARVAAHMPAGVLAQAWRGSPRQHAVMKLVRTGAVRVESLSEEIAARIGLLLAASGASDVVDAHVVLLARKLRATVVTSDPHDLRKLDPALGLVVL
ncbi:PIN domain-containing protein [Frankia sp. CiP1_Cm_nod1]|uniref:PIN domain-containing protein n=1 Tax=Frankia sp. CiP1_Cm_nod1 TaxID=2897160 RepID=UPI0020249B27